MHHSHISADGSTDHGVLFRMVRAVNPDTTVALEFSPHAGLSGLTSALNATTDTNAFTKENRYPAAVTYSGTPSVAGNIKFYMKNIYGGVIPVPRTGKAAHQKRNVSEIMLRVLKRAFPRIPFCADKRGIPLIILTFSQFSRKNYSEFYTRCFASGKFYDTF